MITNLTSDTTRRISSASLLLGDDGGVGGARVVRLGALLGAALDLLERCLGGGGGHLGLGGLSAGLQLRGERGEREESKRKQQKIK